MTEKTLFGIIAGLLLSVSGVGGYAAVKHPDAVAALPSTAVSVVASAVSDTAATVARATAPNTARVGTAVASGRDFDNDDDERGDNDDDGDGTIAPAQSAPAPTATQAPASKPAPSTQPAAGTYTMAQVAAHNNSSSCYTAIQGSVYDLTPFTGQHPGGSAILQLCGIEGTAKFMAQHGGQGKPERELASLKIGVLAQ